MCMWLAQWLRSKEAACKAGDAGDTVPSWVGKIPWRRARQPSPVFLPGESCRQRSLTGYSAWGHEESDMTEVTELTCLCVHVEGE